MQPIAIRSLQCVDHAMHVPPRTLGINWFLGKRCNYDCSYCSPHTHDAVSPFVELDTALRFADRVHDYCRLNNKTMKWSFTGGEPFIDPGFMDLVQHIGTNDTTIQMNVITNGSLPLEVYQRASPLFRNITVSLHLERSLIEIASILDKISNIGNCTVNLMMLPGRTQQVLEIVKQLQQQNTPFVVRKITPNMENSQLLPYKIDGSGKKQKTLMDIAQQKEQKILWKKTLDAKRSQTLGDFYSPEETEFLSTINQTPQWHNCGTWFEDLSYTEINTDHLVANDKIGFNGWTCYAGVDQLYIDYDGTVYRGVCLNDGPVSHISDWIGMQDQPTVCQQHNCVCNFDICVRKFSPTADPTVIKTITGNDNQID